MNNRGQALIETVVVMNLVFVGISILMTLFLLGSSYFWGRHCLHEALICMAEGQSEKSCEHQALSVFKKSKIKFVNFNLSLSNKTSLLSGQLAIRLPMNIQFMLQQNLKLPMIENL